MKNILLSLSLLFLVACSSAPEKPTTDVCSLKKHFKDPIFQVRINGKKINKHWYIKEDAVEVYKMLAKNNKCVI